MANEKASAQEHTSSLAGSPLRRIGPGLVLATAGVGAGDLVAPLSAGRRYGFLLIWAIVIGLLLKFYLAEGVGRWHIGTGRTIVDGWRSLGRGATWPFLGYLVIWGFIVGAAVPAAVGLALAALIPVMSASAWAVIAGIVAFVVALVPSYRGFQALMKFFVIVLFVTVVVCAIIVLIAIPSPTDLRLALAIQIPADSVPFILGLAGGTGGSLGVAIYGYWVSEVGWRGSSWIRVLRVDAGTAFVVTGIFAASMLVLGAVLLFSTNLAFAGNEGLVDLADLLQSRLHPTMGPLFLIGVLAATFTSAVASFQGAPYFFAELVSNKRTRETKDIAVSELKKTVPYRLFMVFMAFPPMVLHLFGTPYLLVLVFAVIGALFMPFLAATLLVLLNSKQMPSNMRNPWHSNLFLSCSLALFGVLAYFEISGLF